jgi:hypothetical protein
MTCRRDVPATWLCFALSVCEPLHLISPEIVESSSACVYLRVEKSLLSLLEAATTMRERISSWMITSNSSDVLSQKSGLRLPRFGTVMTRWRVYSHRVFSHRLILVARWRVFSHRVFSHRLILVLCIFSATFFYDPTISSPLIQPKPILTTHKTKTLGTRSQIWRLQQMSVLGVVWAFFKRGIRSKPPKNGLIALSPNTHVVKCQYSI